MMNIEFQVKLKEKCSNVSSGGRLYQRITNLNKPQTLLQADESKVGFL